MNNVWRGEKKCCRLQHCEQSRALHWNLCLHPTRPLDEVGTTQTRSRFRLRGRQREHIILYNGKQQQQQKKNSPLTDKHRLSRFLWRITNTEILSGWENKMFLSLFSASLSLSLSLSGWGVWMSEWVTGQPAVSGYFLKLFIRYLSCWLCFFFFSPIFRVSLTACRKVWGVFGECAAVQSRSFWAADVSELLQLTVSCLVEGRGPAVERASLRAAWNWFLRWALFWWPCGTERGRKNRIKGRKSRFPTFCRPSGIKRKYYLSVDTQPSIHPSIHSHGNRTLGLLACEAAVPSPSRCPG